MQDLVLRVPGRKNSKMYPGRTSLSWVLDKMFTCKPAQLHSGIILLATYSILNACLHTAVSTVTLYYVLHQTNLEFWHIQHPVSQVYPSMFSCIQYYDIFTHIETLRLLQASSGIFSTLCDPPVSCFLNFAIFWALAYLELEAY